jgi:putative Mg2+ transporter-C (MgtC) family protein
MEELFTHHYYLRIIVAIICGSIIGLERQYRNKAAGFRTIVLICLGSTIFTIVSQRIGGSDDRVAANILTGIGFIGAGVIFNDRVIVKGLTTAAVIWVMAAIGMVIGIDDYIMGFLLTIIVLCVLSLLHLLERSIDQRFHMKTYTIVFHPGAASVLQEEINRIIRNHHLRSKIIKLLVNEAGLNLVMEITGHQDNLEILTDKLLQWEAVKSCEVI